VSRQANDAGPGQSCQLFENQTRSLMRSRRSSASVPVATKMKDILESVHIAQKGWQSALQ
jgi:hypothetical protein